MPISEGLDVLSIQNLKPGLRNIVVKGVIVEHIEDPPQSATEIQNFRYHYKLADTTGCVDLAVPHELLNDIVIKSSNIITLKSGHNKQYIESVLFSDEVDIPVGDPGYAIVESEGAVASSTGGFKCIGQEFDEDSDWCGFSDDENKESLKWLLQPGDVVLITSAMTSWSYGHLILVPNTNNITLHKVDKHQTTFNLDHDITKIYSNNKE